MQPTNRSVGKLATQRPWLVLGIWLACIGLLALRGIGVEDRLHRAGIEVPGAAEQANQLGFEHFGESASLVVLLQGPRRELDAQGPKIAAAVDRVAGTKLLSPWGTTGNADTLRPRPDRALVLVRIERPFEEISRDATPAIRAALDRSTQAPLRAHLTGSPDVANGIHGGSIEALARAEVIAAPVLLLVLLLVFRSAIAAGIALGLGMLTIGATRGAIDLVNTATPLDALALSVGSMIGLALGVDYSLLVISRFREELGRAGPREAALTASRTAGRTVIFAGAALLATAIAGVLGAPGGLLASGSAGLVVASLLSVAGATVALPAILALLGPRIERFSLPARTASRSSAALALLALRRPAVAAGLVALLLGALAAPTAALQTGPPDPGQLADSSRERQDYETIKRALGAGWMAPYDIVVAARQGTIMQPRRLAALDRFQSEIARDDDVAAVFGPAPLARAARRLERVPSTLREGRRAIDRAAGDQRRLHSGMRRVAAGVRELRAGLDSAADGAGALARGGDRAGGGTAQLAAGLARARRGAGQVDAGLDRAADGARSLKRGVGVALAGARGLADGTRELRDGGRDAERGARQLATGLQDGVAGLEQLREPAQHSARELEKALAALDRMAPTSKLDPQYRPLYEAVGTAAAAISGRDPRNGSPVRPGYDGLDASLATAARQLRDGAAGAGELATGLVRLRDGLQRLHAGTADLRTGLGRLRAGARRLSDGLAQLGTGAGALSGGLRELQDGARALGTGTARLAQGSGELRSGLRSGASRSGRLEAGVQQITEGVAVGRMRTKRLSSGLRGSEQLGRAARSGHMLLATVDSASPAQREAASFVVNIDGRGSAADITVVPRRSSTAAGDPLRKRLDDAAQKLEGETGMLARVGGAAPVFQDFDARTAERLPLMIAGLLLLTYLVLVPVFRSLLLPLIAVLLNVATVLAAFGVLTLAFQGSAPLGGPGFLDAIIVMGTVAIVFGLSIDYAVFLISRIREGYELTGTTDEAIAYGIRGTARVVTGAAVIMSAVFLSLAASGMTTLRQFGVGLTVAVMLDATVVRLVLLPALIKLAGPAAWWLPPWLERRLPRPAAAA